jgi:RNA-splicing ligase RtcB
MRQDAEMAIGTLGGGNHFLEVGKAETNGDVWITIHCGSRNFGKEVCEYHQKVAKRILDNKRTVLLKDKIDIIRKNEPSNLIEAKIQEAKKDLGIDLSGININGMEYLEGQLAMDYFMDMIFINGYATFNRKVISDNILKALSLKQLDSIECIHNYINFEDMVIRKGAIASYIGDRLIIPFNMADGLLICEGKSNADWNFSAPHGSGRIMARGVASRSIDLKDFEFKMKNVVSTSVCKSTLDESPQAYKNSSLIESLIDPTVTIIDRVKPLLNIKDKGESMTWKERKEHDKKEKLNRLNRRDLRNLKGK